MYASPGEKLSGKEGLSPEPVPAKVMKRRRERSMGVSFMLTWVLAENIQG
jgi:hypothetical protein